MVRSGRWTTYGTVGLMDDLWYGRVVDDLWYDRVGGRLKVNYRDSYGTYLS